MVRYSDVPDVVVRHEKQRQCARTHMRARDRLIVDDQDILRRLAPAQHRSENLRVGFAVGMGDAAGLRLGRDDQLLIALCHLLNRALSAADLREADDFSLGVAL